MSQNSVQSFEYMDMTLLPVRCFNCSKVVGDKWERYQDLLKSGKTIQESLNNLKVMNTCCRNIFMNPPQVPLGLQINAEDTEISKLYNSFSIDEKTKNALTVTSANVEVINLTGDPTFNSKPLNSTNRYKKIYDMTKMRKNEVYLTQKIQPVKYDTKAIEDLTSELDISLALE